MKTSNLLLLLLFILPALILTGVFTAVFYKYRHEKLVWVDDDGFVIKKMSSSYSSADVHYMVVQGMSNLVVNTADSIAFEYTPQQYQFPVLKKWIQGDTLFIRGDSTHEEGNSLFKMYYSPVVSIHVIPGLSLTITDCGAKIIGTQKDSSRYDLHLYNTKLHLNPLDLPDTSTVSLNQLDIEAVSSTVTIGSPRLEINRLTLDLKSSVLEDKGANLQHFKLNADSASSVQLSGKVLNLLQKP